MTKTIEDTKVDFLVREETYEYVKLPEILRELEDELAYELAQEPDADPELLLADYIEKGEESTLHQVGQADDGSLASEMVLWLESNYSYPVPFMVKYDAAHRALGALREEAKNYPRSTPINSVPALTSLIERTKKLHAEAEKAKEDHDKAKAAFYAAFDAAKESNFTDLIEVERTFNEFEKHDPDSARHSMGTARWASLLNGYPKGTTIGDLADKSPDGSIRMKRDAETGQMLLDTATS